MSEFNAKQSIHTVVDQIERIFKLFRNADAVEAAALQNLQSMGQKFEKASEDEKNAAMHKEYLSKALKEIKSSLENLKMLLKEDIREGELGATKYKKLIDQMIKKLEADDYPEEELRTAKHIKDSFKEVLKLLVDEVRIDKLIANLEKKEIKTKEDHEEFKKLLEELIQYDRKDIQLHKLEHRELLEEEKLLMKLKEDIIKIYHELFSGEKAKE